MSVSFHIHLSPSLHKRGIWHFPKQRNLKMIDRVLIFTIIAFLNLRNFSGLHYSVACPKHTSIIHSLVFSLEGRAWQKPEPNHVIGMALVHCILGKFLEVVCHCFSHFSRQVLPSATTRKILAAKGGTVDVR